MLPIQMSLMEQCELPGSLNDQQFTAFAAESGAWTAPVEPFSELAYEDAPIPRPDATQHRVATPVRTPHRDNAGGNGLIQVGDLRVCEPLPWLKFTGRHHASFGASARTTPSMIASICSSPISGHVLNGLDVQRHLRLTQLGAASASKASAACRIETIVGPGAVP